MTLPMTSQLLLGLLSGLLLLHLALLWLLARLSRRTSRTEGRFAALQALQRLGGANPRDVNSRCSCSENS